MQLTQQPEQKVSRALTAFHLKRVFLNFCLPGFICTVSANGRIIRAVKDKKERKPSTAANRRSVKLLVRLACCITSEVSKVSVYKTKQCARSGVDYGKESPRLELESQKQMFEREAR